MVIECTHHGYEVLEEVKFAYGIVNKPYETNDEFNARCTYLHELSRKQHDQLMKMSNASASVSLVKHEIQCQRCFILWQFGKF
ncbi:hypothetical protein PC111_g12861 [Phytophthora cactorum]|nr:hypothetical protein PC111_g12861 [Phytophthora cactorum]KAG3018114.1 hypothetical protein PC120_g10613 [Phytophthora cactorum]